MLMMFAIGETQQIYTMDRVNEFAIEHKLKWGQEKCNVMEVRCGKYVKRQWNLGKMEINSCDEYKYLADVIMRNGSNKRNIEEREIKVMTATRKTSGIRQKM